MEDSSLIYGVERPARNTPEDIIWAFVMDLQAPHFCIRKLYDITGKEAYLGICEELAHGIINAGAPEYNSWGLWNSLCTCCGTPGLIEYFAEMYEYTGKEEYLEYAKRSAAKVIADSYESDKGRCFYAYWDRTAPRDIQTYTGLYTGAS